MTLVDFGAARMKQALLTASQSQNPKPITAPSWINQSVAGMAGKFLGMQLCTQPPADAQAVGRREEMQLKRCGEPVLGNCRLASIEDFI